MCICILILLIRYKGHTRVYITLNNKCFVYPLRVNLCKYKYNVIYLYALSYLYPN